MAKTKRRCRLFGAGSVVVFSVLLSAFLFGTPWKRVSTSDRIAAFPSEGLPLLRPARVLWNERQVPFIDAKTDEDAALLLGMVHAHLRLGQMEMTRRAAFGRLSESLGRKAVAFDEFLRALHFSKYAERVEAGLPPATKIWLLRYVEGVNFYRKHRKSDPFEFRFLGVSDDGPWTVRDILTVSKLVAADFNWKLILSFLHLSTEPGFQTYWKGFHGLVDRDGAELAEFFSRLTEAGSNSFAVRGSATRSGRAMLAGDPHLGIAVPGFWILLGIHSPTYKVVGLSIPAVPLVAIGRNESIAWGGTNMHAWSTDLVDLASQDPKSFGHRDERIGVRFGKDRKVRIRETPYGPIVSDLSLFKNPARKGTYALRWSGSSASDEISALLQVNRAKNWNEFKNAFDTYDAVGIYYTYADRHGNIGLVPAANLPLRKAGQGLLYHPEKDPNRWNRMQRLNRSLSQFNPGRWIVSANQPPTLDPRLASPFRTHASRFHRIGELLRDANRIDRETVLSVQKDVFSKSALAFAKDMAKVLRQVDASSTWAFVLESWDGRYQADQEAPLDISLFAFHLTHALYGGKTSPKVLEAMLASVHLYDVLDEDLRSGTWGHAQIRSVVRDVEMDRKRFKTFGDYHRVRLSYPLSILPWIGKKFVFRDLPWPGASDTVMKASFAPSKEARDVTFGAQARYVFDFSDANANDFMMLGGEDGWIGSENFDDMVDDWLADRWMRMPLEPAAAEALFGYRTELSPTSTASAE